MTSTADMTEVLMPVQVCTCRRQTVQFMINKCNQWITRVRQFNKKYGAKY